MSRKADKLQEFMSNGTVNCAQWGKRSGQLIALGGDDRKVNIWRLHCPTVIATLHGHTSTVKSVVFDNDETVIVSGSAGGSIKVWDMNTERATKSFHCGHKTDVTCLDYHPLGSFFCSGSADTNVKLWDARQKTSLHTYKGHSSAINCVKFTPDGCRIASGSANGTVKLWDLKASKEVEEAFHKHSGEITCLEFHPIEFLLGVGSADRSITFWDLDTFEVISQTPYDARVPRCIKFTPDGSALCSANSDTLKIWSWEPARCYDQADVHWLNVDDIFVHENDGALYAISFIESFVSVWKVQLGDLAPFSGEPAVQPVSAATTVVAPVPPPGQNTMVVTNQVDVTRDTNFDTRKAVITQKRKEINQEYIISEQQASQRKTPSQPTGVVSDKPPHINTTHHSSQHVHQHQHQQQQQQQQHQHQQQPQQPQQQQQQQQQPQQQHQQHQLPEPTSAHSVTSPATAPPHHHRHHSNGAPASSKPSQPKRASSSSNLNNHHPSHQQPHSIPDAQHLKDDHLHYHDGSLGGEKTGPCDPPTEPQQTQPQPPQQQQPQQKEQHQHKIIPHNHKKPLNLDIGKMQGKNGGSSKQSAAVLVEDVLSDHDGMRNLLQQRLTQLKVLKKIWSTDKKGAILRVNQLNDMGIAVDFLRQVMRSKEKDLTLDMCVSLLPIVRQVLGTNFEVYLITAIDCGITLWRAFGDLIKKTLAIQHNQIDLSLEERRDKCRIIKSLFGEVKVVVDPLKNRNDEVGNKAKILYRELPEDAISSF